MEIKPTNLTVGQLLTNSNEQFVIPPYQRRYAWKHNQYAALFDDLFRLDMTDKHLLGTLLFNSGYFTGGLNKCEIIDGQQRIATICLLLLALKRRFEEAGDESKAEEINKYLISKNFDDVEQFKIILGDLDNPDFSCIVNNGEANKIRNRNLIDAYHHFSTCFTDFLSLKDVNKFFYKLINNCVFIRIDINDSKNVYRIFEIINNRGLRLSSTDIIKNFILGHASQLDQRILDSVKNKWSEIIVNLDGINTDKFIRHYISGVLGKKVPKSKLVIEFKQHYKNRVKDCEKISEYSLEDEYLDEEDETNNGENSTAKKNYEKNKINIVGYLKTIDAASVIYSKIINKNFDDDKINKAINDLERIQSLPANTFLINLFLRKIDTKIVYSILDKIKTFMLRRNICEFRTGELDDIFARLTKLPDENLNSSVKKYLGEHLPDDDEFRNAITKHQFKGKNKERAKYFLEEVEYVLSGNKKEYLINFSDEVHLEHIMPLNITSKKSKKEYGDWEEYLGDSGVKHKRYVWRISNLTLLSDELNIGASNNPYFKKVKFYKKSALALNDHLVSNYKQFKFKHQDQRGQDLADIALKIWRL